MSILKRGNLLIAIILFLILLILKLPILGMPYFWDGIVWIQSAEWISNNNLNPILPMSEAQGGLDTGHPPLVLMSLAIAFSLLGHSLIIAHLVMIVFAFLTLYFTYLLGTSLYNKKTGFIAVALLLVSPLFFAQIGIINLDLPLAAFTMMTLYFALRNKFVAYLISGSLLVLSKEPGILSILAILCYIFIKNYKKPKKELFKKCLLYSLPLFALLSWLYFHYIQQQAEVISGIPKFWKPITLIIFFRFFNRLKFFFLDNFHWILTFMILISLSSLKKIRESINIKKIIFLILLSSLILFLFTYGLKFLLVRISFLASFFSLNEQAFYISEKNLKSILLNFYSYRFIFILFIVLLIVIKDAISFTSFKNKKLIPILLTFLFYLLLFSWTINLPRYHLPLYPLFFILSASALNKLFKKKSYMISAAIMFLLITQWASDDADSRSYLLEKNMDYLDVVKTHKSMTNHIEKHFPNATILTFPPMTDELRYPHLGYVKNPLNTLDYRHYDSTNNYKNSFVLQHGDWYYYKCYSKKQCGVENFIPIGEGDIRIYDDRYDEYLTLDDFDLFYYSPQAYFFNRHIKLIEDFNMTLIKKFEKNGRYTELYAFDT